MIGFDFDGTLTNEKFFLLAKDYVRHSEACIITSRNDLGDDLLERATELGIPHKRCFAIGRVHRFYPNKADFIRHKMTMSDGEFHISIFFDNDPYEIMFLQKAGILALWVMPDTDYNDGYQPGGLMAEITDTFIEEFNRANSGDQRAGARN